MAGVGTRDQRRWCSSLWQQNGLLAKVLSGGIGHWIHGWFTRSHLPKPTDSSPQQPHYGGAVALPSLPSCISYHPNAIFFPEENSWGPLRNHSVGFEPRFLGVQNCYTVLLSWATQRSSPRATEAVNMAGPREKLLSLRPPS